MTSQKKNRFYEVFAAIGFLVATVSYSIGSNIMETAGADVVKNGACANVLCVGFLLELINCVAVIIIGVLLFLRLREFNRPITLGYMLSRMIESLLLCVGGLLVLSGVNEALQMHALLFNLAMIILGVYSAIFCIFLFRSSIGPKWLFVIGVAGYVSLAIYAVINIVSSSETAPMLLFAPGAVFEIVFPIWLIVKGFNVKRV